MEKNTIEIVEERDIVIARQAGRSSANELGFGLADQTRLATGISELTRNVIKYAGTGTCTIFDDSDEEIHSIRVVVEDHGPGIPSIEDAMKDGFSTGNSLGAGLPGTKRLAHEFSIDSTKGHTRVSIIFSRWRD